MNIYTGIGARQTPDWALKQMTTIASNLEYCGYTLRSGGADGADSAFESGVQDPANAKIYLPWRGFNNNPSALHEITVAAYKMASLYHPNWAACSKAARKFHARNCYQVLGLNLDEPTNFVICWTPNGAITGGTGQALRIAIDKDIPIINMGTTGWEADFDLMTGGEK